ncbi:MAG: protein-glutamate O-methyltransferase CheR [Pseudomonadota bacterium]
MQESTFNELADLALRNSGQHFAPTKSYLMDARLSNISRRESFATLDDLVQCLKARPNPRFEQEVAAALTGKKTSFFSERDTIEQIVTHALPQRLKLSKSGKLRVWCAGVSTGQEAWSLAMRIGEEVGSPLASAQIEIIGSDLSTDCIETAKRGVYGHFDVQKGLSIHRLMTNFNRHDNGEWEIKDELRETVFFRRQNLLNPASDLGGFDVILCSNVISSLAKPAKRQVVETLGKQMLPDAYLFFGPDESIEGVSNTIKPSRDMRGAFVRAASDSATAAA